MRPSHSHVEHLWRARAGDLRDGARVPVATLSENLERRNHRDHRANKHTKAPSSLGVRHTQLRRRPSLGRFGLVRLPAPGQAVRRRYGHRGRRALLWYTRRGCLDRGSSVVNVASSECLSLWAKALRRGLIHTVGVWEDLRVFATLRESFGDGVIGNTAVSGTAIGGSSPPPRAIQIASGNII